MSKHTVSIDINGTTVTKEVDSRMLLVHFIREALQMTGTHIGCDTSKLWCLHNPDERSLK
jgi:Aerobic-type carbon monoxide dehydrogenase, small subunit CoxS/CutS homologs